MPSRGHVLEHATCDYVFDGPDITPPLPTSRSSVGLTQLSGEATGSGASATQSAVLARRRRHRRSTTSPLPTDQFPLGSPFRLGAYDSGEIRGDHYYVATGGYLQQLGRLPDFMGGPVFAGGWLENGDAFDDGRRHAADQRQRRRGDGHAGRPGDRRRLGRVRRPVAHLLRGWSNLRQKAGIARDRPSRP